MKKIILLLFVFFEIAVFGQDIVKSSSFLDYQRRCNFDFKIPEGFKEIKVIKAKDLKYDLNLINETDGYCIRYSFFDGESSSDYIYNTCIRLNLMNFTKMDSTAKIYTYKGLDSVIIKSTNATEAGFTKFDIKSKDGKGYKWCTMFFIHKHNIANLYITMLYNDSIKEKYNSNFVKAINSIKFKNE